MEITENTDLAIISAEGQSGSRHKIELWSLVLQAVNVNHEIGEDLSGWYIRVAKPDINIAQQEIDTFEQENQDWPPPQPKPEPMGDVDLGVGFVMLSLVLFFSVTGPWEAHNPWFSTGAVSAAEILHEKQWWRLLTGLTLHADAAHLLGNVFFGGLLFYYLSAMVGVGTGTIITLSCGVLGNFVNIVFRSGVHHSVGFSTAVFGLVGVLCSLRWLKEGFSLKGFILPVGAAIGLLAFLGSSGERTDLGAHFWGLATGFIFGAIAGLPFVAKMQHSSFFQAVLVILAAGLVWWCWHMALVNT